VPSILLITRLRASSNQLHLLVHPRWQGRYCRHTQRSRIRTPTASRTFCSTSLRSYSCCTMFNPSYNHRRQCSRCHAGTHGHLGCAEAGRHCYTSASDPSGHFAFRSSSLCEVPTSNVPTKPSEDNCIGPVVSRTIYSSSLFSAQFFHLV
jgi:hypothetical protein